MSGEKIEGCSADGFCPRCTLQEWLDDSIDAKVNPILIIALLTESASDVSSYMLENSTVDTVDVAIIDEVATGPIL